jgi:hypothetical protein
MKADALFAKQNWADARAEYDAARDLETDWRSPIVRRAVEGAVAGSMKLQKFDDVLARAQQFIEKTKGALEEAVGERFLASLYMAVPHYGTKQGPNYLRGQYGQGVHVGSWNKDRKAAIQHYERARDLLAGLAAKAKDDGTTASEAALVRNERIGADFDLSAALATRGPQYGSNQGGWAGWWWAPALEPEEESEAVEEADYEEPRWGWGRGWRQQEQAPPTGIPVGPDGKPQFLAVPDAYAPTLGEGPKIRFLLEEIQRLDTSATKNDAARALFRWAMIARNLYESAPGPQKPIWELGDNEALTRVGGELRLIELPPSESPVAILQAVQSKYPNSDMRIEARYTLALFFQSRQQFPRALAEYRKLIETDPAANRTANAKDQIKTIQRPEVMLNAGGVHLTDTKPRLTFTYRNTGEVRFKAFAFDLAKYVQDTMEDKTRDNYWNYRDIQWRLFSGEKPIYPKYVGKELATWTEKVARFDNGLTTGGATLTPLGNPGAYLVEAQVGETTPAGRTLILVTDIAIVEKSLVGKGLIYIADARTGQPLPDKAVKIYEHWQVYNQTKQKPDLFFESTILKTNPDGVIEYKRKQSERGSQVDAIVLGEDGRMAFSFFQSWSEYDPGVNMDTGPRRYVITDRPVYRPGQTVRFRVWVRQAEQGQFQTPRRGEPVLVAIYDPRNNEAKTMQLATDEFGGASGEYTLGDEPPLGVYQMRINGNHPDARYVGGAMFRVEEYKKPEFEVTVKPSKAQARLGEKIKARIEARYYFGAPVARGKVTYKVFREDYRHVYFGPDEYDWLYGRGYGRYWYPYPWFRWWGRWGCCFLDGLWPYPYWTGPGEDWRRRYESGTRKALRELVAQGEAQLAADGSYEVEIDTARAKELLGDRDHRYTVEAEVRDESRRTIQGQGSVLATRQEFYAFVETRNGWYRPREEAFVEVRTLTPDNVPVAAKGEVVVARIRYGGPDNAAAQEEVIRRWEAETDAQGRLAFRFLVPQDGQYRVTFKTQDSWKEEVQGNAVFWAAGPKFEGAVYRFNDLEIIADKRNYKVGETAHLLINAQEGNSRLLFSDSVVGGTLRNYRFIDLPGRSIVVDIPIAEKDVPNFFVEATMVRNGRVQQEMRELFVPPVKGLLTVAVKTDKPTYKPGEKGRVTVEVTDSAGKPVAGQVTLTAFDEAVTYIQDEFGPSPRIFYYGQRRESTPRHDSSLSHTFGIQGSYTRPEHALWQGGEPEGWNGIWGPRKDAFSLSDYKTDFDRSGRFDVYFARGEIRGGGFGGSSRALDEERIAGPMGAVAGNAPMAAPARMAGALYSYSGLGGEDKREKELAMKPGQPPSAEMVEPEIRMNFADTALWLPAMRLNAEGTSQAEIVFPQSLTTWRLHGYALTNSTQVGDSTARTTTTKNLLVRLQAPRFFMERDEVVLSANVHNYLKSEKPVTADLIIPADLLEPMGDTHEAVARDKDGNLHLRATSKVAANSEHRFDWPVRVRKQGLARITVKALTDEESDGMAMAFPVLVHGINKTVAQSGSYRVGQAGERQLKVDLPKEIDPEQTRLEITLSPSIAGVMIDALPYLVDYPYGCVEQTMSRFYPAVVVADALKKMGTNLDAIGRQRSQAALAQGAALRTEYLRKQFDRSPVFSSETMNQIIDAGLNRIYSFQRNDGGWGWWKEDDSSPYMTAYVIQGLHAAIQAGVKVDRGIFDRGLQYLQNTVAREIAKPKDQQQIGSVQCQAYLAYILAAENRLTDDNWKKWLDDLYTSRAMLNNYGKSLLALALHHAKRPDDARLLLRNVLQFVERDDTNETAWVRTPDTFWWFWWNNDIETNAWALKAMVAIDPKNDLAPRLVKWLVNNRRNGYYWRSTRDTAQVIAALVEYMHVSGESRPDYTLAVSIDGRPMKEVRVTSATLFTFDNRVLLYGLQIKPGPHTVTIAKKGEGALYYSAYLSYFTLEEDVKGAGNEVFVTREYFKLVPKTEAVKLPDAGAAKTLPANRPVPLDQTGRTELRAGFDRVPLKTGDAVKSGDQIEVVLRITSKNTYDYLVFEDMKPAGCEPVEVRSGGRWAGGLCANLELRDEKVVFFIGLLEQGEHILRYKLRAETPGKFHAMPTTGYAMYAPEIKGISDEMRLGINE